MADRITIMHGDCREQVKRLADCSIDSCVTDPPYELVSSSKDKRDPRRASPSAKQRKKIGGFMNLQWDATGVAFDVDVWAEVLRVLNPGGHVLAFGGDRTHHRLMCAIEDAGFDIRTTICWHFGQGFPKSLDVSKAIDRMAGAEREVIGRKGGRYDYGFTPEAGAPLGYNAPRPNAAVNMERAAAITAPATDLARLWAGWGTALKPATEFICLARKPLSESSVAANVLRWGTGALNIDATRIGSNHWTKKDGERSGSNGGHIQQIAKREAGVVRESHQGRWPANVVYSHSPLCERVGEGIAKNGTHIGHNRNGDQSSNRIYAARGNDTRDPGYGEEIVGIWDCHESCPIAELNRQSGELVSGARSLNRNASNQYGGGFGGQSVEGAYYGDSGSASRFYFTAEWSEDDFIPLFYYIAKASRGERDAGLDNLPDATMNRVNSGGLEKEPRWQPSQVKNAHSTVKPVTLMAYLCKLITPPNGIVLDCFAGSGTTGRAAIESGFRAILIEQDAQWIDVINHRCATQIGLPLGV